VARSWDVTVVLAPALRGAFEGRREVNLGLPASAGVGEVLESLFQLYPRAWQYLLGEGRGTGLYLHIALDERASEELARGGGGLSAGLKLYFFALSRTPGVRRPGVDG
jgi:sulfur-carrier protein